MTGNQRAKSLCGTAEYLSPEVLEPQRSYGIECDWWSFGCVIFEMLSGYPPFYSTDRKEMFENIRTQNVNFPENFSIEAKDLLSQLLVKNPKDRLTNADEIMKHQFYRGVKWDDLMRRIAKVPYKPVLKDPTDTSHFDSQ